MMIGDKQTLRRCIKQIVRHAPVVETRLDFDVQRGELGVEAMLGTWTAASENPDEACRRALGGRTPVLNDAVAMFAALDALDFPVQDLTRAAQMQKIYTREAYLREILDVMNAKCVLVRTPLCRAQDARFEDDRFHPLLAVGKDLFIPGRFGVPYEQAAQRIIEAARLCGAHHVLLESFDAQAVRYCLMPACEDAGLMLHVGFDEAQQIEEFSGMLEGAHAVRALVYAEPACERQLIAFAKGRERMLVRLSSFAHIEEAFSSLGMRFVPYGSAAVLPEQMLGRWIAAKEKLWQALCAAYLPLARTGYEIDSEALERDVEALLCGHILDGIIKE